MRRCLRIFSDLYKSKRLKFLIGIFIFVLILAAAPSISHAAPSEVLSPETVSIPAGGEAVLPISGFCLDRGLPFPGMTLVPIGLAPSNIRSAIMYSAERGYIDSSLYEVQSAIWDLSDGELISNSSLSNEI